MDVPALWIWLTLPYLLTPVLSEEVSVTATRRPARGLDVPAAVSVLDADRLARHPAVVLDDALRATPGFSLFRRGSSRTANPTTQGVTLRGLSASGAGRTLVLADGAAVNDPFGGWVSWLRLPVSAVERVEVARGGLGSLYGPDAAGGVVQVFTRQAAGPWRGLVLADVGQQATRRASAWTGATAGSLGWTIAAERFESDGAVPVARAERGPVDEPAGVAATSGLASVRLAAGPSLAIVARGEVFDERRANGTPLQRNDTNFRQGLVELDTTTPRGTIRLRATRSSQSLDQTFSAVSADRARETLTSAQRVGAARTTASGEWTAAAGGATWLAGVDARWSDGRNRELRYVGGVPAGLTEAGGDHGTTGAFGQVAWALPSAGLITAGLRLDAWRLALPASGRDEARTRWSPRVSWSWPVSTAQAIHASAYRAFRPPTLNELVRGFRVGNAQTLANAALEPETLSGGEVAWQFLRGPTSLRAVAFLTSLDEAVVNVTVSATPTLITRERRNAGRIRSRGGELEGAWRATPALAVRGALSLTDARLVEAGDPALRGRRVPQVPRWQASVALDATLGALGGTVALRGSGRQFDDDRNQFELRRAVLADVSIWWRAHPRVSVLAAVENVADADYDVGRTPVRTVGTPRAARVGARVGW